MLADKPLTVRCVACLVPGGMRFRLDKVGRPYGRCTFCQSVVFLATVEGLAHWRATDPDVVAFFESNRRRPVAAAPVATAVSHSQAEAASG